MKTFICILLLAGAALVGGCSSCGSCYDGGVSPSSGGVVCNGTTCTLR